MNRREFLKQAGIGAAALALPWALPEGLQAAEKKPNIIFILSDDVGLGNIGCCGGDNFKTPRIDALAKGGTRFEQCYSTPLCGPSRCLSLTGRYPFRTGMISNQSGAVPRPVNEIMIPTVLKKAGYVTAEVGKWSQLQLEPSEWGFDEYLTFVGSGKYWAEQDPTYTLNGKKVDLPADKYLPDVMHEFLVDFITRHKDQPFFVYYPMSHMHGPILRTPDSTPTSDHYADNIAYMDKLVGKLVDELERLKLRDNTLIIFVGDNGTAAGWADRATVNGKRLSGQKGTMLEGGSRVPMIVSWPGTTPAGREYPDLIDFSDFMPTFAALAGAKLPADRTIDGHDFTQQLKGKKGKPREWVYVELNGHWYVRNQGWKLTESGELFDMKDAPFVEKPVPADTTDPKAIAGRKQLQTVLDKLNPAAAKSEKEKEETASSSAVIKLLVLVLWITCSVRAMGSVAVSVDASRPIGPFNPICRDFAQHIQVSLPRGCIRVEWVECHVGGGLVAVRTDAPAIENNPGFRRPCLIRGWGRRHSCIRMIPPSAGKACDYRNTWECWS